MKPSNYSVYLQTIRQRTRRSGATVLSSFIDAIDWDQALARLATWARMRESRYVCLCNVHSVVTADQDPSFHEVISGADLALPDGAPVAWVLQNSGFPEQQRINGPDLMWRYMKVAEELGQSVFFYGSSEETLTQLRKAISKSFPTLRVAGMISPPYGEVSAEMDQAHVDAINRSGAHVLFVGLGCPKQEAWMAAHKGRIHSVMLGVGAAFDYHAGTLRRAPVWMQNNGLEWAYRLACEPRRLFKRYLLTNSAFVWRQTLRWTTSSRRI
jgi:N-acetylglucosaminyldiphosphoundecaprenol N-acetyl-beta-D-mannosaminyltransferase